MFSLEKGVSPTLMPSRILPNTTHSAKDHPSGLPLFSMMSEYSEWGKTVWICIGDTYYRFLSISIQSITIRIKGWLSHIGYVSNWGSYCLGFPQSLLAFYHCTSYWKDKFRHEGFYGRIKDPSLLWDICLDCRWPFYYLHPALMGIYKLTQLVFDILTPRPYSPHFLSFPSSPTEVQLIINLCWQISFFFWVRFIHFTLEPVYCPVSLGP